MEFVRNLLYGYVGCPEQNLCLGSNLFGNPIVCSMPGCLLKHYREVLGAYAQFV